ncbi:MULTISPECIES: BCCT family transporter [Prauserella salsuginis group]|uniref:BCCT family transporter n=1 Tax=Prauserella salsuginis TaxID=387889 RepID=A0ABW6FX18_9PSEU|nr:MULTISPECIES: BCCT family transporter [Prauserella salsuginis group]MCR3720328.1 choline/carnitine/betaine transport [Prauserella flava]MCR3733963.1 choline/carnitine/betaine transport [Prauserella salsuginis]
MSTHSGNDARDGRDPAMTGDPTADSAAGPAAGAGNGHAGGDGHAAGDGNGHAGGPDGAATVPAHANPPEAAGPGSVDPVASAPAAPAAPAVSAADREAVTDRPVFAVAAILALAIIAWGVLQPGNLLSVSETLLFDAVIPYGGWVFVLTASGFVVFAIALAISRYGRIKLGQDKERPEFRTSSWVAMMFSAGMGIGLMFFGATEPVTFLASPPPGTGLEPNSDEALHTAMATTLFHWTLHPWAIYAVVGLAIAYSAFRRGRSQLLSSVFWPLLGGRHTGGPLGKAIDVMAIFATLFGSAASLGLGALQVGGGLGAVGWIDSPGSGLLVGIIAVLTVCFIASAVSGVAKGIQWLSNINMVLAAVLAVFILVVGPTVMILNLVPNAIGDFVRELPEMAGRTGATGGQAMENWLSTWTIFYWAWWISWTPFVGMFIARISRGRTIRQFIIGVIAVPSAVSLVWFAIFGGAAMDIQQRGTDGNPGNGGADLYQGGEVSSEVITFTMLEHLPWFLPAAIIVMILVSIFFVSGADAASVVMGTLSQRGSVEPKRNVVIFWGVIMGAVAAVMLIAGGETGLDGLQYLTILIAVPFVFVMVGLCVSLWKDLRSDPLILKEDEMRRSLEEIHEERTEERRARRRGLRARRR